MVNRQQAEEMRDAIKQLEQAEALDEQATQQTLIDAALSWWVGIKPAVPTTREEALSVFRFIENLIKLETDRFRKSLLINKLNQANEKFKEIKRYG